MSDNDRWDFYCDCETLSTEKFTAPVIDFSAYKFNWGRFTADPYTFEELINEVRRYKLDVTDQVKRFGDIVQPSTLQFWESQPKEVRRRILPKKDDLKVEDFVEQICDHISSGPKVKFHWSRNNTFDPIILYKLARQSDALVKLDNCFPFWGVRDIKTWIDAKFDFAVDQNFIPVSDEDYWNATFEAHNSVHDVAADIMRLQTIKRGEEGLEQVAR